MKLEDVKQLISR